MTNKVAAKWQTNRKMTIKLDAKRDKKWQNLGQILQVEHILYLEEIFILEPKSNPAGVEKYPKVLLAEILHTEQKLYYIIAILRDIKTLNIKGAVASTHYYGYFVNRPIKHTIHYSTKKEIL